MFLQRMMALYVASHYKNSPNDLQLMSDAPAHRLFALLAPVDQSSNSIPEILAVVQVALEGAISKQSAKVNLAQGKAPQVRKLGAQGDKSCSPSIRYRAEFAKTSLCTVWV